MVIPDLSIEAIANLGKGIEAAAAEAGNIEVTVVGTLDIQRMVEAMEDFAAQGVDAIIYDTIDAAGIATGVEAANAAGVPVIGTVSRAVSGEHVSFIAADECAGGRAVGEWIADHLDGSGPGGDCAGERQVIRPMCCGTTVPWKCWASILRLKSWPTCRRTGRRRRHWRVTRGHSDGQS